jgi:hypothetical protein
MEQQNRKLSDKNKEVENLSKEFPEEIKIAAEAMKRTIRFRKICVIQPKQYTYKRIF